MILLAWIVILSTFLPGIDHGIWRPDEPQVAGISSEAARTGDFVVPRLNGKPFLEKPPLYYDAAALSGMALGHGSDVPFRLVSMTFCLLSVLMVYAMVRRRTDVAAGLASAGILATTWGFFMVARWIQVDTALVFGVALAMYLYLRMQERQTFTGSVLLGLAVGVAFMAKGLVGPAIIVSAVLADAILKKDLGVVWKTKPVIVVAAAALPVVPWILGLYLQGGWPFLRETLIVNNLMRFLGSPEGAALGHQNGPFHYVKSLPANALPWTLVAIPALASSFRNFRKDPYLPWFIGPLVLLCLSSTKRSVYLVPLYPALACLIGTWLMGAAQKRPWEAWMVRITWGLAALWCVAPLAGIRFGLPLLSVVMAGLSLSAFAAVGYRRIMGIPRGLSLVLVVCIAFLSFMAVYFPVMKPREDYLGFAREALALSRGEEITIYLGEDEILEGVLPMVKGARLPERKAGDDLSPGLYAWVDNRRLEATKELEEKGDMEILTKRKLGSKHAFLGRFTPADEQGTVLQ
ncbi:MAG TPA: glycosyltransferase family 39 protein [Deltaproteobacteria bacterium]|nr:glycosyltransferase family 39 protein [Deltaproteobacteria bacterium]HOI07705.1 glycosyltransferase family 39 protein [Deltaproteobacteria bacterium]